MALNIGNNAVANAFVGSSQVRRAYKGGTLVYQGFSPASELEFIQQTAAGGPAQLLKVYGKTIVNNQQIVDADRSGTDSNKTTELRAERIPVINVWDEEWENGYIKEDGKEIYSPLHIKSAHLIPILPATKYWFKKPARTVQRQAYYDANGDFLSLVDLYATVGSGGQFTTPSNAHYLKFYLSQYPYAGGVCINLFDPAINGTYYPHWRGSLALNLSTLTGKLNGEGTSVVVFPDGLRGVGSIRDEAEGSTGVVRLGKRAYQAGDESDTSVLTDGTNTIYPLATPLTYTLDTPLPTDLTCEQGDIMQRVSDNNCPFVGEMKFGL